MNKENSFWYQEESPISETELPRFRWLLEKLGGDEDPETYFKLLDILSKKAVKVAYRDSRLLEILEEGSRIEDYLKRANRIATEMLQRSLEEIPVHVNFVFLQDEDQAILQAIVYIGHDYQTIVPLLYSEKNKNKEEENGKKNH